MPVCISRKTGGISLITPKTPICTRGPRDGSGAWLQAGGTLASGAQDARLLFRGPWAAVRWGRSGRAAGVAREGNAFSRGQESARKARPCLTDVPSMDGRNAPTGVAFSFGYFSLGHAREK